MGGPLVVVIQGPTAVGKTDLSIPLAEELGTEIISADSMQIYRHMDIGTAKPTPEQRRRVTHHIIDVVDPDERFTVADFKRLAEREIERLVAEGKIPVVVGGTRLYIWSLTRGLVTGVDADFEFRRKMMEEAEKWGSRWLHQQLRKVDPERAEELDPHDWRRIIRALEVYHLTGQPMSKLLKERTKPLPYRTFRISLVRQREELRRRIAERAKWMLENGLLDEVKWLLDHGYGPDLNPMRSHGYLECAQYLLGQLPWEEVFPRMERRTWRHARKQLSWLERDHSELTINLTEEAPEVALRRMLEAIHRAVEDP